MRVKRETLILLVIFLIVLAIRLLFAFKTSNFADDTSYFNLRQIENIGRTGVPIYQDALSYSGRYYVFLPVFHYLISVFDLFLPDLIALKLIPNLLVSLLVFLTYLCAKEITQDEESSLIAALFSGFLPIIFYKTVNSVSTYTLVLPLTFAILLCLIRMVRDKRYIIPFITLVLLMTFTDQSIIVLVMGFFTYLFLAWLEKMNTGKLDLEIISFSTLLVLLLSLILFKQAFLTYGPEIIKQNIPSQLIQRYFSTLNIFEAIYQIGVIPLIFGIYVVYKKLFVEKSRSLYVLISFSLSLSASIFLGLIELQAGLLYFSVVLAILSAGAYKSISDYIKQTKFSRYKWIFTLLLLVLFTLSSLIPSLIYANQAIYGPFTNSELASFIWIRDNTPEDSVVIASLEEGHLVTAISNRKNIIDTNFLLQKNAEQVLDDLNLLYKTRFTTDAVRILNKYGGNYIVVSNISRLDYGILDLSYVSDKTCFNLVYDSGVKIYESTCVVEEG